MNNFQINNKNFKIGIIGVGYVGIKLVVEFAKKKFKIVCFDKDYNKLRKIKDGKSPFSYIESKVFKRINNQITITKNFSKIPECDAIIICLPTPLRNKKPDLSQIKKTWREMKHLVRKNQIIILESTSYPGTTEEIFFNYLSKKFKIGENIFLAYSPERENPGDTKYSFRNIPKIVAGIENNSKIIAGKIYSNIIKKIVFVDNLKIAEMAKLLENIYRSVNIALINELKIFSSKVNIDINKVIDAAKTKPFGFQEFRPGPGVGGHCIPIDPLYLSWLAKKNNFKTRFIELASKTNIKTTHWTVGKINKLIKINRVKKVLLMGVSYKKNIEDTRESSGIKIFQELNKKKIKIDYCDPYVPKCDFVINKKVKYLKSKNNSLKLFKKYDAFIICADHDKFNYKEIIKLNKFIFDLRGRCIKEKNNKKIIQI